MEPAEFTAASNNPSSNPSKPRGIKNTLPRDHTKPSDSNTNSQSLSQLKNRNKRRRRPYGHNTFKTVDRRLKADAEEFTPTYEFDLDAPQFVPQQDPYSLQPSSAEFVPSDLKAFPKSEQIEESLSAVS